MDRLQSMRVFQEVVDEGGFAAAARKLDMAPAMATRFVNDLEAHLGVRLLQRTTRRLSLTAAGEAYLGRVRLILCEIEEADAMAQAQTREMSGTVRVLALPVVATHMVAPAVAEFHATHPDVVIDLHVDEVGHRNLEDFDFTVLNGLVQVNASTVVRTILHSEAVFCAAPDYLRRHGEPQALDDLRHHRCLRLRTPGTRLGPMHLIDPTDNDRAVDLEVPAVMTANHTDSLVRATLDGAGISSQPVDLVAPMLRTGQLRRVLAPWITNRLVLVAALPTRQFMPARTRAFLEHLIDHARRSVAGLGIDGAVQEPAP